MIDTRPSCRVPVPFPVPSHAHIHDRDHDLARSGEMSERVQSKTKIFWESKVSFSGERKVCGGGVVAVDDDEETAYGAYWNAEVASLGSVSVVLTLLWFSGYKS
mmetsp:Transcript_6166/g.15213  ORF Transcript_6166/g.15213 Transcript_6166/m.15213 type:complete len:104 (-) Transcript_6166:2585-2896(-)